MPRQATPNGHLSSALRRERVKPGRFELRTFGGPDQTRRRELRGTSSGYPTGAAGPYDPASNSGWPLPAELRQKQAVDFALDTTLLPDGWHILSYHVHAIDQRVVPGFTGNQLASEVKIPICVDNQGQGGCPLPAD